VIVQAPAPQPVIVQQQQPIIVQAPALTIYIDNAMYYNFDVTARLQQAVLQGGGRLFIPNGTDYNQYFGRDPAYGVAKQLVITYRAGNGYGQQKMAFNERQQVQIDPFPPQQQQVVVQQPTIIVAPPQPKVVVMAPAPIIAPAPVIITQPTISVGLNIGGGIFVEETFVPITVFRNDGERLAEERRRAEHMRRQAERRREHELMRERERHEHERHERERHERERHEHERHEKERHERERIEKERQHAAARGAHGGRGAHHR